MAKKGDNLGDSDGDSSSESGTTTSSTSSSTSSSSTSSSSASSQSDNSANPQDAKKGEANYEISPVPDSEQITDEISGESNIDDDDNCKIFLSRIPQTFDEDSVKRVLEETFGEGCVLQVSIVFEKSEDQEDDHNTLGRNNKLPSTKDDDTKSNSKKGKDGTNQLPHRGFAFVTFSSQSHCQTAIDAGTVRGSAKPTSKRRHTLYIQPVVRDDENAESGVRDASSSGTGGDKNICFLWKKFRCPYGDQCKFVHEGEGGCADGTGNEESSSSKKEKKTSAQKCFSFKKKGKCKLGDKCPYSHDFAPNKNFIKEENGTEQSKKDSDVTKEKAKVEKSEKDCINWKNKGKCRKGDKCPYRHDESVRKKVLAKKKNTASNQNEDKKNQPNLEGNPSEPQPDNSKNKRKREGKNRQTLSVRVFGLNYSTTEEDIRKFFQHCGPLMEVTFPTFEDSNRSKGYCGVLFQSPKAVQKAVEMNGKELHGRWLSIQEGKMFLRKWEEVENERREGKEGKKGSGKKGGNDEQLVGEFGQKMKKRKKHGFKE